VKIKLYSADSLELKIVLGGDSLKTCISNSHTWACDKGQNIALYNYTIHIHPYCFGIYEFYVKWDISKIYKAQFDLYIKQDVYMTDTSQNKICKITLGVNHNTKFN
jgi:hypothetical protein